MEIKELTFSYQKKTGIREKEKVNILNNISFQIEPGKITTFLGANGCGKSTLLHLMTKNLKPNKGVITLDGKNIQHMKQKEFAKKVAIVHQNNTAASDITVGNLVSYGRTPHLRVGKGLTKVDYEAIDWAMEVMDIAEYRDKPVISLSGGQRQRVWIAMALAQKTKLLFLDEPTTYMDVRYQIELLEAIQRINQLYGITIVMVLHDMNHAIYYSHNILGIKEGNLIVNGKPNDVVTSQNIEKIYGIQLSVTEINHKKVVMNVR